MHLFFYFTSHLGLEHSRSSHLTISSLQKMMKTTMCRIQFYDVTSGSVAKGSRCSPGCDTQESEFMLRRARHRSLKPTRPGCGSFFNSCFNQVCSLSCVSGHLSSEVGLVTVAHSRCSHYQTCKNCWLFDGHSVSIYIDMAAITLMTIFSCDYRLRNVFLLGLIKTRLMTHR